MFKNKLVTLYKECCSKLSQKVNPTIIFPLKENKELALDMDCLLEARQEGSVFNFVR